jgi:hypothetical protein
VSLLVATQITAVATGVLAVGAVVSAIFAFLAFRKQSVEVKTLLEERRSEAAERHREQAVRILIWEEHTTSQRGSEGRPVHIILAHIRNASNHPIYDLTLYWYQNDKIAGNAYALGPLIPGNETTVEQDDPDNVGPHAVLEFRDVNGVEWQARPDGALKEVRLIVRSG